MFLLFMFCFLQPADNTIEFFVLFCSTKLFSLFFFSSHHFQFYVWMGCSLLTESEDSGGTESTCLLPGSVNAMSTLFERLFLSLMTSQALSLLSPWFSSLGFPSLPQSANVSQFTCKSHLFPKLFITDNTACLRRYVFVLVCQIFCADRGTISSLNQQAPSVYSAGQLRVIHLLIVAL